MERIKALAQFAVIAAVIGLSGAAGLDWQLGTTPKADRNGWAPDALPASQAFVAAQPRFQITVDGVPVRQDNRRANVRLWEHIRRAHGSYPPNVPQEEGDCTSWGTKHAIEGTSGAQIVNGGKLEEWRPIFAPFTYGAAKKWVLKGRIRGPGATGASVAEASKVYGVLFADEPGLPPYTGSLATLWASKGPPAEWKAKAAEHKIKTASLVTTADEIRDAVCNFYGVIICSDWGAQGRSAFFEQDGRMVARRQGSWSHCMCVDGYDGTGSEPYFHVQNSWGENAHPKPIDDSPPGGFWIRERDMDYIARQGDSWALSDFDGFPARLPDLFGQSRPQRSDRVASLDRKTTVAP
jgi:hypothetical protein